MSLMRNVCICIIASIYLYACGDLFAYKKRIINDYYLREADGISDMRIDYNLGNGSFIGKVPEKVLAYGYNDSVLVAKTERMGRVMFYIIDMNADSEFAEDSTYLLDTLNESDYSKKWQPRLLIKFNVIDYYRRER